jgi:hypothetical protein
VRQKTLGFQVRVRGSSRIFGEGGELLENLAANGCTAGESSPNLGEVYRKGWANGGPAVSCGGGGWGGEAPRERWAVWSAEEDKRKETVATAHEAPLDLFDLVAREVSLGPRYIFWTWTSMRSSVATTIYSRLIASRSQPEHRLPYWRRLIC